MYGRAPCFCKNYLISTQNLKHFQQNLLSGGIASVHTYNGTGRVAKWKLSDLQMIFCECYYKL